MKKNLVFTTLLVSVVLMASIMFVSAGWFAKLTGNAVTVQEGGSITAQGITIDNVVIDRTTNPRTAYFTINGGAVSGQEGDTVTSGGHAIYIEKVRRNSVVLSLVTSGGSSCTDSDGGILYYVAGSVSGDIGPGNNANFQDYCLDSNTLIERYCPIPFDASNFTMQYTCPNGCSNGACLTGNSPAPSCDGSTIILEESQTIQVDNYQVSISYIDSNSAKLDFSGEITNDLAGGQSQQLIDGTTVSMAVINYPINPLSNVHFSCLPASNSGGIVIDVSSCSSVHGVQDPTDPEELEVDCGVGKVAMWPYNVGCFPLSSFPLLGGAATQFPVRLPYKVGYTCVDQNGNQHLPMHLSVHCCDTITLP